MPISICNFRSTDQLQLTQDELLFVKFARALADWLEPYHNYARPHPTVVLAEAARQTEIKTGHPLKGVDLQALNGTPLPNKEEPPVVIEPPELVTEFFNCRHLLRNSRSFLLILDLSSIKGSLLKSVREVFPDRGSACCDSCPGGM